MRRIGLVAALGYIATIFAANWLIEHFGIVDVLGTGLQAPAAVYAVGAALVLRDVVHRTVGPRVTITAILIGATLSYLVAPSFAIASAAAFLFSESADMAVYTPLSERTWAGALALSNIVGAAIDSALFLWLAFGSLAFFWGQFVGKAAMTVPALLLIPAMRRAVLARKPSTELA